MCQLVLRNTEVVVYSFHKEQCKLKLVIESDFNDSLPNLLDPSCYSAAKSRLTLCDPTDCSMPGSSVLDYLPEFAPIHVHCNPQRTTLVMLSNHLILCHPLCFSNESVLHIKWPKYWSVSFNISNYNEYSELITFRIDWFDFPVDQGTLKRLIQHHSWKATQIFTELSLLF